MYEERLGIQRSQIEYELRKFEDALNTRDNQEISSARKEFSRFLDKTENEM